MCTIIKTRTRSEPTTVRLLLQYLNRLAAAFYVNSRAISCSLIYERSLRRVNNTTVIYSTLVSPV